ncbi:unnamed protein product [Rotaria sp. Silwood1]|nr:unnamed protein product [Rotaria sp. Silwood1]CAF4829531.1 unnamed protein product [Rotaria sp. Silwood1]
MNKILSKEENNHQWDRPLEFVLSLISNSVGLGNVWRFPYLAAQNGGGAFLIPYFLLYFLIGAPLYYMELALGQFTSRGPASGFVLARGWQGVGFAMIINSVLGTLYYNVIIAWALFYFVLSFRKTLLWSDCGHWWNSNRCFVPGFQGNTSTGNDTTLNCTALLASNLSNFTCPPTNNTKDVPATEEFFYSSFDDFGVPGTYMSVLLLGAWIIICLCIFRGVQSSGKVAYFTAIFPYIVLLILIIFTATLEGAGKGIRYYIVPRWKLIGNFQIWQAAASQVFFSLSISFGSLIAYSAANDFHNKFFQQMCIVVCCDCFTGVFAGFAVFATVGFLATSLGREVEEYAQSSGPGLAFITYPEALSKMPASPFFSIIFFLMLLALGLGSQVLTISNLIGAAPLSIKAAGGFPDYEFPRWSVILGWFIFVFCILPIPLVFIISYIREYRRLSALQTTTGILGDNSQLTEYKEPKPIYLQALTANNSPADTWGPRRRKHQKDAYAHLAVRSAKTNIPSQQQFPEQSSKEMNHTDTQTGVINPTFDEGSAMHDDDGNTSHEKL